MSDPYQPIPCIQHERLEFSVLRRLCLDIEYWSGSQRVRETVLPLDVNTRKDGEWLKVRRSDGEEVEIRLDAIQHFTEMQNGK